ncbi:ABC transporter permease [Aquamicrobium sp. LC103]|uniref:ABC transporter permease n=1 Tax=Aquamicrobium sp. LC103 TaxID=1120658 RepID=UPI00063E910B|nr:ABC transporter permease [Aquamicrobium sp. LC103]TKT69215.1 ABC transporter permease [Aquamicrobium sp. LC103]
MSTVQQTGATDQATFRLFSIATTLLLHLSIFAALIAMWEGVIAAGLVNEFLLPRPSRIAAAIGKLYLFDRTIYWHFAITMYEAVAGFAIGAAVGIALAVSSALNDTFRRYVAPYAIVLNVTPGLALTPIVIAWFGFGWGSKIALAAIISFFPIFVNTLAGLTQSDADRLEMFRSLGASRFQIFWKLRIPDALPVALAGLKIGMTTALIGAVVAEFAQATEGVGVLMQRYSFSLDMAAAIATLLSMSLMGLILFSIMELVDDRVVFWRRDARMAVISRKRAAAFARENPGLQTNNKHNAGGRQ